MRCFLNNIKSVFSYLLVIIFFVSCDHKSNYPIKFDFEKTNSTHFISNNNDKIKINNSWTPSYYKSGKHSTKIFELNPFGLSYNFENLKKGNQIIISVWEKTDYPSGYLKLIDKKKNILLSEKSTREENNSEWQLISIKYTLKKDYKSIKFFIHNPSSTPSYYDDLYIDLLDKAKGEKVVLGKDNIDIEMSEKDLKMLYEFRSTALENGIINKSLKKYFKGFMIYKKNKIPIKIRLKGDWTDHLKSDKWSFRIKIDNGYNFKGMKSFSIQHPKTRSFLKEWIIHKIFKHEGILTTRYEFVSASLNGEKLGIYALEEHFRKELIQNYNYENGPILKFDEEGLWEVRLKNPKNKMAYPWFESSEIIPFNNKEILKSKKLTEMYNNGKLLMQKYKSLNQPLDDVFDLNKAALFFAINDLGKSRHSYHWHNQRLYYNPLSDKLEFIAYDCYAGIEEGIEDVIYGFSDSSSKWFQTRYLTKQFFNNSEFLKNYKKYLKKISEKEYIKKIYKKFTAPTDSLQKIINYEFPIYDFNMDYLSQNAEKIRETLLEYDTNYSFSNIIPSYNYSGIKNNYFPSIGLKAKIKVVSDSIVLSINNFHLDTVYIIGYGEKPDQIINFKSPIEINPFQKKGDSRELLVDENAKYLCIKPQNLKRIEIVKIK